MQLSDSRDISADRDTVYSALLSPEVLQQCVPGCQELTGNPEDGFEATVVQKVGPVKATFKGQVTLSNMNAPESLTLSGEGKGGADVKLEEIEGGTRLHYDVEAKVGGKLAQLGSRIIDGFAKKMADQFFENFANAVEGPKVEDEAEEGPGDQPKKGWFKRLTS